MPKFAHNPQTGEVIIFDDQVGSWRKATRAEVDVEQSGFAGQVEAAVEGATGVQAMLGMLAPEFGERSEALTGSNTAAATVGAIGTLGTGIATGLSGRMAGRVQQGIQQGAKKAGGTFTTKQGFRRQPEEMLPESLQGAGQIIRSGAETLPVTRMVTDYLIRTPNQRNLNRLGMRALGLTDDEIKQFGGKITDEAMALADSRMATAYDEVGEALSSNLNQAEVVKLADAALADNFISARNFRALTQQNEKQGRTLMALASDLKRARRSAQESQVRNQIDNILDEIDNIMEAALESSDDVGLKRLYDETNARYKASIAFEKGQSWSNEAINAKSMDTALRGLYKRGYRRGAKIGNAPAEVSDFLQGVREAQGVNIGVPTSGTAERMFAASLLGGSVGVNVQ